MAGRSAASALARRPTRPTGMVDSLLPTADHDGADPPLPAELSEAYFRSLVENARDVIHVMNADRTTRYVTPSVKRLLGYEPEELVGRLVDEFAHPDDVARVLDELRATADTPGPGCAPPPTPRGRG